MGTRFEPLEMPPNACRKAEADDVAEAFGMPDRLVQRRRPELLSKGQKPAGIPGRLVAVSAAEGHHPSAALQRQQQSATAALRRAGSVRIAFQSDGASSGIAKTAVA